MIKLQKGEEPEVLREKYQEWTDALLARFANNEEPTNTEKGRYRHPDIKAAVIKETAGKCAYCESKVRHITYGDIEHVIPKSSDPKLAFLWSNLTLACDICNTNKGTDTVVDPYIHEPSEHLRFIGPLVFGAAGNDLGCFTEKKLQLNRTELVERRTERLESLRDQVDVYARTTDPALKKVLKHDLEKNELLPSKEYAAISREFLKQFLENG